MQMKIAPYTRNVYYYETDRMDVVSHTNYIRWMEEARVDFLKKTNICYDRIESMGIMIPVLGVTCSYKSHITFGDDFAVTARITAYNGFKMTISYEVFDKKTRRLCARATSSHCFTDSSMKPLRISRSNPRLHEEFLLAMQVEYDWDLM